MPSAEHSNPDPSDEENAGAVKVTQAPGTADEETTKALEAAQAWGTPDEEIEEVVEATPASHFSGEAEGVVEATPAADTLGEEVAEAVQATQGMQDAENFSPGLGPRTRRRRGPGNLWTLAAREDMFRRREAGEGWETIILDYPNRSRHAMQQQYSMMKKQIAIADGTWVSNRRGRKRKVPPENNWPSVNRQPRWQEYEGEDDETEDDDFGEPDAGDSEDAETEYTIAKVDAHPGDRPLLPARSATDPVPRPTRSHFAKPPTLQPISLRKRLTAPDSSKASTDNECVALESSTPTDSRKRRKLFPALATSSSAMMPAQNSPSVIGDEDEIFALQEGISELLEQANETRRMRALNYETEKSSQYQAFKASVTRANRRAEEVEERLRVVHYQYGEAAKIEREQNAVEIDALKENFQRKLKETTETADEKLRIALQDGNGAKVEMERQVNEVKALKEEYENGRALLAEQFEEKLRRARQDGEAAMIERKQKNDEIKALEERFDKAWKSQAEEHEEQLRIAHQSIEAAKQERELRANEIKTLEKSFEREQKVKAELHSQKAEAQQRSIDDQIRSMKLRQVELEGTVKTYQREMAALKAQLQGVEHNARSLEHEERLHATIADLQKQLSAKEAQLEFYDKIRLHYSKLRIQRFMLAADKVLAEAELRHGKLSVSLLRLDEDLDDMGMKAIRKAVGQIRLEVKAVGEGLSQAKQSVTAANERLYTWDDSINRDDGSLSTNGAANHNVSTG